MFRAQSRSAWPGIQSRSTKHHQEPWLSFPEAPPPLRLAFANRWFSAPTRHDETLECHHRSQLAQGIRHARGHRRFLDPGCAFTQGTSIGRLLHPTWRRGGCLVHPVHPWLPRHHDLAGRKSPCARPPVGRRCHSASKRTFPSNRWYFSVPLPVPRRRSTMAQATACRPATWQVYP